MVAPRLMTSTNLNKAIGALLGLLIISAAVSAQTRSGIWLTGTWEGTGYQVDDKSTWTMVLNARGRTFTIDYPSLNCGGKWKLTSTSTWRAQFVEKLDRGQDKCADNGTVTILRLNRNQAMFFYAYAGDREVTASAILSRKR